MFPIRRSLIWHQLMQALGRGKEVNSLHSKKDTRPCFLFFTEHLSSCWCLNVTMNELLRLRIHVTPAQVWRERTEHCWLCILRQRLGNEANTKSQWNTIKGHWKLSTNGTSEDKNMEYFYWEISGVMLICTKWEVTCKHLLLYREWESHLFILSLNSNRTRVTVKQQTLAEMLYDSRPSLFWISHPTPRV